MAGTYDVRLPVPAALYSDECFGATPSRAPLMGRKHRNC
jgi:hypothetical protein